MSDFENAKERLDMARAKREELRLAREERHVSLLEASDEHCRVVTFFDEIDGEGAHVFSSLLRSLARHSEEPITIILDSPGGEISAGFVIYDEIQAIKQNHDVTVHIVVRGTVASMAAILLQAATGQRVMGPNALLMLHRASFGVDGTTDKVKDALDTVNLLEGRIIKVLGNRTHRDEKWWKRKLSGRKDVWFTAEEALKEGLVDAIG